MAKKQTFEGVVLASSTKAVLFHGVYWDGALWLPRSQIEVIEDDDSYIIEVSGWLAGKNNLFEFEHYNEEAIAKRNEF